MEWLALHNDILISCDALNLWYFIVKALNSFENFLRLIFALIEAQLSIQLPNSPLESGAEEPCRRDLALQQGTQSKS